MKYFYVFENQYVNTSYGNYSPKSLCEEIEKNSNFLNEVSLAAYDFKKRSQKDSKIYKVEYIEGVPETIEITLGDNYSHPWTIVIDKNHRLYDMHGEIDPYNIIPGKYLATNDGSSPVRFIKENLHTLDLYKIYVDADDVFVDKVLIKLPEEVNTKESIKKEEKVEESTKETEKKTRKKKKTND